MVQQSELLSLVKLAWRSSSQSILEKNLSCCKTLLLWKKRRFFFMLKSIFLVFWVKILCSVKKRFFLCLLCIYTFSIASFHFFCQLIELGSKLGLQMPNSGFGWLNWVPKQILIFWCFIFKDFRRILKGVFQWQSYNLMCPN